MCSHAEGESFEMSFSFLPIFGKSSLVVSATSNRRMRREFSSKTVNDI